MKAWVQTAFGGPEVRELKEVPVPTPAADEVLVEVFAVALNRLDILQRHAPVVPGFALPHIAGMDVVGKVVETGGEAGSALGGKTVVIDPVVSCGTCDKCQAGKYIYCRAFRTIGSTRDGGFAEFVAVPATNCNVVADCAVDLENLAGVPVASVTAWHGLLGAGKIAAGETIVIPGAGSGLGSAGIQIAKDKGCTVITLVSGADKVEKAKALGADFVIDRKATDWVQAVQDFTGGEGADMVWDHVGGPFLQQALLATRDDGRVVLSGTTAGLETNLYLPSLYQRGRSIIGHGGYTREEMRDTVAAYCRGDLKLVVDSTWAFEDLPKAEARLESNAFFGKVLVSMGKT